MFSFLRPRTQLLQQATQQINIFLLCINSLEHSSSWKTEAKKVFYVKNFIVAAFPTGEATPAALLQDCWTDSYYLELNAHELNKLLPSKDSVLIFSVYDSFSNGCAKQNITQFRLPGGKLVIRRCSWRSLLLTTSERLHKPISDGKPPVFHQIFTSIYHILTAKFLSRGLDVTSNINK